MVLIFQVGAYMRKTKDSKTFLLGNWVLKLVPVLRIKDTQYFVILLHIIVGRYFNQEHTRSFCFFFEKVQRIHT